MTSVTSRIKLYANGQFPTYVGQSVATRSHAFTISGDRNEILWAAIVRRDDLAHEAKAGGTALCTLRTMQKQGTYTSLWKKIGNVNLCLQKQI